MAIQGAIQICLLTIGAVAVTGNNLDLRKAFPVSLFNISGWSDTTHSGTVKESRRNTALRMTAQRGTISGKVVLPSGQAVNNRVKVTLTGARFADVTAYTNNEGRFIFTGISDGTYTLEVIGDPDRFLAVTQEVRVTYGSHPVLIVAMRERGSNSKKPTNNVVAAAEVDTSIPEAAKKEFEKGTQSSNKGNIQDAIQRFKKALEIHPNYLMARNNLGAQYLKLGQWPDAIEQFEAAIAISDKALSPRQNLAIALIEMRKYPEAVEHLNEALSIDSSSATVHLYLGIASLGVENVEQAERALTTALSLGGNAYSIAHFYRALAHMKKGEREPAMRELKSYLDKAPEGDKAPRAKQLLERLKQQ
jgi:Flp pilus assembly protein TadD